MKYIRTEDNIYEITDKQYDILCGNLTEEEKENYKNITSLGIGSVEEGTYKSILIKNIIKKADTPEELCDEFVLKTTSKESGKSYYGLYYYSDIKQFKVKEGFKGIWYGGNMD